MMALKELTLSLKQLDTYFIKLNKDLWVFTKYYIHKMSFDHCYNIVVYILYMNEKIKLVFCMSCDKINGY
jgi:hypothetical protein